MALRGRRSAARASLSLLLLAAVGAALLATANGFRPALRAVAAARAGTRLFGYVSPERDPEYKDMVKKSLLPPPEMELESESMLPIPKEGDIVQYPGKWPEELLLGRIRFVRFDSTKDSWQADIVPLKEGKSESVFVVDRSAGTSFEAVDRISPVRSFYLRNENGYKIAMRKNSTEVILRAPAYRVMESTYVAPSKPFSLNLLQDDLKRYEELKTRMVLNTIKFSAVGAIVSQLTFGSDVSGPYLTGRVGRVLTTDFGVFQGEGHCWRKGLLVSFVLFTATFRFYPTTLSQTRSVLCFR
jgi:hypothetical protein